MLCNNLYMGGTIFRGFLEFYRCVDKKKIIIQADMYYKLYKNICSDVKLWVVGNHQIHKNKMFMHSGKFKFPLIKKSKDHPSRHVL